MNVGRKAMMLFFSEPDWTTPKPFRLESPMSAQELLMQEIPCTPEPILAEVYHYLQYLKSKQADDRFDGMSASHSVLSRDWDSPEEDAAWARL